LGNGGEYYGSYKQLLSQSNGKDAHGLYKRGGEHEQQI